MRLHFCEIDLNISHINQRSFRIDIDSNSAEDDADVIWWTGNRDTPIYNDYVVLSKEEKVEDNNKFLPIGINTNYDDYRPNLNGVILNGVEVFKLINPEGTEHNLAIPSPMVNSTLPASSANDPKKNKTIFLAIGSLGFLVVLTSLSYMVQLMKFTCWRDPYRGKSQRAEALSLPEELCRHFSLNEIRTATNNFHKELIIG